MLAALRMRRCLYITSTAMPGSHAVLVDSGAQFSAAALRLVQRHRVPMCRPQPSEPQLLAMAERTKTVRRIGTVTLAVVVHFSGGTYRQPYSCTKKFEVLDMNYDFILGVDFLPRLFPFDDVMNYLLLPSRISTPPQSLVATDVVDDGEASATLEYATGTGVSASPSLQHATAINDYVNERITDYYAKLCAFDMDGVLSQRLASTVRGVHEETAGASLRVSINTDSNDRMVATSFSNIYDENNSEPIAAATTVINNESGDDVPSLMEQVSDMGIGEAPPYEVPQKPTASTPSEKEAEYKPMRNKVLTMLQALLRENEAITGFCNDDSSVVTLSVRAEDEQHVYSRQYPIPQALESHCGPVVSEVAAARSNRAGNTQL